MKHCSTRRPRPPSTSQYRYGPGDVGGYTQRPVSSPLSGMRRRKRQGPLRPAGASRLEVLSSIVCIPLNFPLLGRLSIWFEPNPVPFYTGDNPCYSGVNEWQYTAYLEEQGGAGVTIERFTWDFYDQDGQYLGNRKAPARTSSNGSTTVAKEAPTSQPRRRSAASFALSWASGRPGRWR